MTTGIYALFDAENKECLYVGQSKDVETRYFEHLKSLKNRKHKRKDFVNWFYEKELNSNSIICCFLEECLNLDATKNNLEIKWFNELKPRFFGKYPSLNEKWAHTEESKNNISKGVIKTAISQGKTIDTRTTFKCKFCNSKTKNCSEICFRCFIGCESCQFDLKYKLTIVENYLIQSKSIREISRIINIDKRIITNSLIRWGIEVIPRSFNGKTHSPEALEKIQKARENQIIKRRKKNLFFNICSNCSKAFDTKQNSSQRFCSRACYLKNASEINQTITPRIFSNCENCSKSISFIPSRPRKFCSKECFLVTVRKNRL